MAMQPEEMAQLQQQAGKPQESIIDTAKSVGMGLNKLGEALERGQNSTPEEKQQMAQIISLYADLVEKKLGGEAGAQQQEQPGPRELPMEGGATGVPMNMNMRS
jgi:hypothetical protein